MPVVGAAPNYTVVTAGQSLVSIGGGGSIIVHGVFASTLADTTLTLFENDGTTVIARMSVAINTSEEIRTEFLAPRGVKITTGGTGSDIICTIFHTSTGA